MSEESYTDDADVSQLEQRIDELEATIRKMLPSRREAIGMGVAGLAGASLMTGTASAGSAQVGTIGDASNLVDIEAEDINVSDTINGASVSGANTDQILSSDGSGGLTFNDPPQGGGLGEYAKIVMDSTITGGGNIFAGNSTLMFGSNPSNYDSSTGEYTVGSTGVYLFNFQLHHAGTKNRLLVYIKENGNFEYEHEIELNNADFENFAFTVSDIYEFSAGDVLEINAQFTNTWGSSGIPGSLRTGFSLLQIT